MKTVYPVHLKDNGKVTFKTVETAVYGADGLTTADHIAALQDAYSALNSAIGVSATSLTNLSDDVDALSKYVGYNGYIKDIAYKGLSKYAPENTMPAFKLALQNGFKYIYADVKYTSDGTGVILHDSTIDKTARDSNGNAVTGDITTLTYDQVSQYDFGRWFYNTPTNIKIPTVNELLRFCKLTGAHPYLHFNFDLKVETNAAYIHDMVDRAIRYGMTKDITWASFTFDNLQLVRERLPFARVCFMTNFVNEDVIRDVTYLKENNGTGEVVICSGSYSAPAVNLCRTADIPMEVFVVDDPSLITDANSYVSGVVTSGYPISKQLIERTFAEY